MWKRCLPRTHLAQSCEDVGVTNPSLSGDVVVATLSSQYPIDQLMHVYLKLYIKF